MGCAVFAVGSLLSALWFRGLWAELMIHGFRARVWGRSGEPLLLGVRFTGPRDPQVTWSAGGRTIAAWRVGAAETLAVWPNYTDMLTPNTSGADLTLKDLEPRDSQNFTVRLSAVGQNPESRTVSVTVYDPLADVFLQLPAGDVREGDTQPVTLRCVFRGTADGVLWLKGTDPVARDPRHVFAGPRLLIIAVNRTDSGNYTCTAHSPLGHASHTRELHVVYGPDKPTIRVTTDAETDVLVGYVLEGDNVTLTCAARSYPPATYVWRVGDPQNPPVPLGHALNLRNIQLTQNGIYTCHVFNLRNNISIKHAISLHVYQPPRTPLTCSLSAADADTLSLSCRWPGGFPGPSLSWWGVPGVPGNRSAISLLELEIPGTPGISGKNLSCRGIHPTLNQSCTVTPVSPRVSLSRWAEWDRGSGLRVSLRCRVESEPESALRWFRGDREIGNASGWSLSEDRSRLDLRNYSLSRHPGGYTCRAHSPLGSHSARLTLSAPMLTAPILTRLNDTTVVVSWTLAPTAVVSGFRVQVRGAPVGVLLAPGRAGGPEGPWRTLETTPSDVRSLTVTGVSASGAYSFRVVPLVGNEIGLSSPPRDLQPLLTDQLSRSAMIGVIVGSVLGFLLLVLLIVLLIWKCRKQKEEKKVDLNTPDTVDVSHRNRQNVRSESSTTGPPEPDTGVGRNPDLFAARTYTVANYAAIAHTDPDPDRDPDPRRSCSDTGEYENTQRFDSTLETRTRHLTTV